MLDDEFLSQQPVLLSACLDLLPQEIVFINREYSIIRMNASKKKQHPTLKTGMKCFKALGFSAPCDFCLAAQAEKMETYIKNPVCIMTGPKKNKPRHINITIAAVRDSEKRARGFIEIIDNVEALYQSHNQLEYLNREYESVIYALSHDLRSPLISIEGFSRKLQKLGRTADPETFEHCLRRIHANVETMNNLVNVLLDTSRIITGKLDLQEVDMQNLVTHLAEDMRLRAGEQNAEVRVEGGFPPQLCDKIRIQQVFSNLIDNALKHGRGTDNLEIEIGADANKYWVKDNGPGMSPEIKDKIFEPFTQSANSGDNSFGMGMNIIYKIIRKHNGEIWIETEEGGGTAVYFTIKADSAE